MIKKIKIWFHTTRPALLWISGLPVFMATMMAASDGGMHIPSAMAVLAGVVLIHISWNLTNAGEKLVVLNGVGDLFTFILFGPVAVAGTYYVQLHEINLAVVLSGIAPGLFTVGVLTINNIRDWEKDRRVAKKTLTVRFGKMFSYYEYLACMLGAALVPVLVYSVTRDHVSTLLATLVGFAAIPVMTAVLQAKEEAAFNQAIGGTIKLLILYTIIFSIGWIF